MVLLDICLNKKFEFFQFNGTTLLKWTDRFGTSHPLPSLGNGQCNLKAPTLFTDEGKITEKSLLPIKSWSYGPRQFEYEKIAITIGGLRCEQNNSIEPESQENMSTLKTLINTKAADIKNEMVNLHDQMEIGTNGKIDDLKTNMKLFVVENVNASETLIETRIQDLETNLKGLIQNNNDNFVDMKQYINYCVNNPCHNLATCVNIQDGFECNCVTGKVIIYKSRNESSLWTGICVKYFLSFPQTKLSPEKIETN